jgi:hypothetical protein
VDYAQVFDLETPAGIEARVEHDVVVLRANGGAPHRFRLWRTTTLTQATALAEVLPLSKVSSEPVLVIYDRASPDAREILQQHGVSYVGREGRWHVSGPSIYIDRDRPKRSPSVPQRLAHDLNPFAKRASRLARWLLLHPTETYAIRELAHHADVSEATASRTIEALTARGHVRTVLSEADRRTKRVTLARPDELLEEWRHEWERRRVPTEFWRIGARDPDEALHLLTEVGKSDPTITWAVGGLAGAAMLHRAVDPADVFVWVPPGAHQRLAAALMAESVPRRRADIRIAVQRDPWVFELSSEHAGVVLADPVQLWLDCSTEGERALEAADAVRATMNW